MSLLPHQFGHFEYWIFVLIFSTASAWRTITNIQNSTCPMWQLCAAMMSWLFTNRLCATRWIKVKRMGISEILRRIWLFSAKPLNILVNNQLNSSLRHIIVTQGHYSRVKNSSTISCRIWSHCGLLTFLFALFICTWFLKNQVGKVKFDELDF